MSKRPQVTDFSGFTKDLMALRRRVLSELSTDDYKHLRKIIWTNRAFLIIGFATAWIFPNPLSMICIGLALHGQWTIVAHHVLHEGYDKVPGTPKRYHSTRFARGWRRLFDWLDWMYPAAWKYEHNVLHHYYTNEDLDPDFVPSRVKLSLKKVEHWPTWLKTIFIAIKLCIWKPNFYSLNTLKAMKQKKNYDHTTMPDNFFEKAFYYNYLPYISFNFILIPLLFLPLGTLAAVFVLINRIGAEFYTNVHAFFTIVTNHAGDDLAYQPTHFKTKEEYYIAQLTSTVNFKTGGFWNDYLHGYLNYQIEHHLFSDFPASQYQKIQPEVKALCKKYGIKYRQESVFKRAVKLFQVMLSLRKMKDLDINQHFLERPTEAVNDENLESQQDKTDEKSRKIG